LAAAVGSKSHQPSSAIENGTFVRGGRGLAARGYLSLETISGGEF